MNDEDYEPDEWEPPPTEEEFEPDEDEEVYIPDPPWEEDWAAEWEPHVTLSRRRYTMSATSGTRR